MQKGETKQYAIYREKTDELLNHVKNTKSGIMYAWCRSPVIAFKYLSHSDAMKAAQKIADNKNYCLAVCELHKSDRKIGLENPTTVLPRPESSF